MELLLMAAGWAALMVLTWRILPNWFVKRAARPQAPKKPWPAWVNNVAGGAIFGLPFLTAGPHAYLVAAVVIGCVLGICDAESRQRGH